MTPTQRRVEVSSFEIDGKLAAVFYDIIDDVTLDDLGDFVWALSDDGLLDPKSVSDVTYILRRFWEFLAANRLSIGQCRDSDIERFRNSEFRSVMSSSKAKQKDRIAKNTVNARLRFVYRLLAWLQLNGRIPIHSIGAKGCRVRSSLPDEIAGESGTIPRHASGSSQEHSRYPKTYRRVGAKSKHATKFVPSEQMRFAAIAAVHDAACDDYLAHRNALLIDFADAVGWRRESINSITREQVDEALVKVKTSDYASICPPTQKFGYVETFDVPGWLVERMGHFAREYLDPLAREKGWQLTPKSRFFLGVKGRPLQEQSITKIVSTAMRAAGAPRFVALHAFRRKFTNDEIADETRHRLDNGLDTSAASIAASVSIRLGQRDPESIYAYVSRSLSAERTKVDAQRREHMASLERQVTALKARVRELEASAGAEAIDRSDQPLEE